MGAINEDVIPLPFLMGTWVLSQSILITEFLYHHNHGVKSEVESLDKFAGFIVNKEAVVEWKFRSKSVCEEFEGNA